MGPKRLPSELLLETVLLIPAEKAVPNLFLSCRALHNFLVPKINKWKVKMAAKDKIINELKDEIAQLKKQEADRLEKWVELESEVAQLKKQEADRLEKWVDGKSRLADQCMVTAADGKLVDVQLAIAKMLIAEFVDERPHWERFNDDAAEAVRLADSKQFCAKIVCRVDELNRRWRQLEQLLATRVNELGELRRTADEFDTLLRDLQRKVRAVELSLNEATALRCHDEAADKQRQLLDNAQSQAVAQLGLELGQLREKGTHLVQSPVATAALRSDVEGKVDNVAKAVHELETKLDSIRKAAENESASEDELLAELDTLISWAREQKRELDAQAPIAAEPSRLSAQIEQFRHSYDSILTREGQVIVVSSKTTQILAKTPSAALKQRLFALNETWPALHSAGKKRQDKLDRVKRAVDELEEAEHPPPPTLQISQMATVLSLSGNSWTHSFTSIIDDMDGSSRIPRPASSNTELASNHSSRPASRASDTGSDFGGGANSASATTSRIPAPRAQQQPKGVQFASGTGGSKNNDGSGRNTPSAL